MPWPFSESIKKRACRYLLQRYLGHFLQEKLSLEQLSLDLYQGTGSLAQVPLDKWVRAAGGPPGGHSRPCSGRCGRVSSRIRGVQSLPGSRLDASVAGLREVCASGASSVSSEAASPGHVFQKLHRGSGVCTGGTS